MQPHRPSILHRPARGEVSQATKTTVDTQYEKEQAYWQQKQQKAAETHDRLLRSIYTTSADKAANAAAQQEYMHVHMQAKMMESEARDARDKPFAEPTPAAHVYVFTEDRPWLNPSMIYSSEADERMARRKYEEATANENRQLAAERALIQRQLAEQENAHVRSSQAQEVGFWNVGAQGGKYAFALPERRRPALYDEGASALPTPTAASSQHPPVWAWSGEEAAPARANEAAAPAPRPYSGYQPARAPYAQPMSDHAPTPTMAAPFAQLRPTTASRTPWATDESSPFVHLQQGGRQMRPSTASRSPWATEDDLPAGQQSAAMAAAGWKPQQTLQQRQFPWSQQ